MNTTDYLQEILRVVREFALSDEEQPSPEMVEKVNAFFRTIDSNDGQKTVENAAAWRTIAAQRLVINLIRDLSTSEQEKAEKALKTIAGTFVSVRWVGGEWRAYVAKDGMTAERFIDQTTALKFKSGTLSTGDFIEKVFPYGLPEKKTTQSHRKGWRR